MDIHGYQQTTHTQRAQVSATTAELTNMPPKQAAAQAAAHLPLQPQPHPHPQPLPLHTARWLRIVRHAEDSPAVLGLADASGVWEAVLGADVAPDVFVLRRTSWVGSAGRRRLAEARRTSGHPTRDIHLPINLADLIQL